MGSLLFNPPVMVVGQIANADRSTTAAVGGSAIAATIPAVGPSGRAFFYHNATGAGAQVNLTLPVPVRIGDEITISSPVVQANAVALVAPAGVTLQSVATTAPAATLVVAPASATNVLVRVRATTLTNWQLIFGGNTV